MDNHSSRYENLSVVSGYLQTTRLYVCYNKTIYTLFNNEKIFGTTFIFTSLLIATVASVLGVGIIEPILPLYAKSMDASGIVIGLIFAEFAL